MPEIVAPAKRKRRAKWNPQTRELDYPPTRKQLMTLRDLCEQAGIPFERPASRREAQAAIVGLIRQRRRERRRRRRDGRSPDWRFGVGQTFWEERTEIEEAKRAGRMEEYEAVRRRRLG